MHLPSRLLQALIDSIHPIREEVAIPLLQVQHSMVVMWAVIWVLRMISIAHRRRIVRIIGIIPTTWRWVIIYWRWHSIKLLINTNHRTPRIWWKWKERSRFGVVICCRLGARMFTRALLSLSRLARLRLDAFAFVSHLTRPATASRTLRTFWHFDRCST